MAILLSLGWSSTAGAQTNEEVYALEELVVTAQRRAESIQDVPLSVSALSAETVAAMGADDTLALTGKIPSLSISNNGPQLFFLRGIGTTGSSNNAEQSVATYLDGVYLYSTWSSSVPLGNVERIEVLKGPQGTLFGRNTTGGVIQVVTADPSSDPGMRASVGYGNFDTMTAAFYGAARLSDKVSGSLSVDWRDQGEGYGRSIFRNNEETMWSNSTSVQAKTKVDVSDATTLTALLWYHHLDSSGNNTQAVPGYKLLDGQDRSVGRFDFTNNTPNAMEYQSYLGYVKLEHSFDFADLVSISSYREVQNRYQLDQDVSPNTIVAADLRIPLHNFSQEFQLLSSKESRVEWLLGAFYFEGSALYEPGLIAGSSQNALGGQVEYWRRQDTKSLAGFGQATIEIVDGTRLTAGARYTDETIELPASQTTSRGVYVGPFLADELSTSDWTWRLAVDQRINDDVMVYASYNRGLKSGGFGLVTRNNLPAYNPEKLDAYEIGVKSEFFNRRVRVNAAAFMYDFTDIQVTRVITGGNTVANAASAEMKGIDLDFEASVTPALNLWGAVGWLSGKYVDYPDAVAYDPRPTGGAATRVFDASGNRTIYTPEWSWSLGANYEHQIENGSIVLNGFVQYVDNQYVGPMNVLDIPQRTTVNGSVSWWNEDHDVGLQFWVRNAFDEVYFVNRQEASTGYTQAPAPPRTFGVTLSFEY